MQDETCVVKMDVRKLRAFYATLNIIPVYLVINDLFFGSQCKALNSVFKSK